MSDFHTLAVTKITHETPNSVVVSFDVPPALQDHFQFTAGQYVTLKKEIDGMEVRRAYSICSNPSDGALRIGIKKVADGTFSVYANEQLKEGDRLEVMPPEGVFTFKPDRSANNSYMAVAAGSGITPVISIISAALEKEPNSKFVLFYGNRSLAETMFYDELSALQSTYGDRLSIKYIFSRKEEEQSLFGRIDRSNLNYLLRNSFSETTFDRFFLCGPESMIEDLSETLKEQGVADEAILYELFTTSEVGVLEEDHDGNTAMTVTVDDETFSLKMSQKKSVLEAVLEEGIDAPYSCQGGICSTCIARVTEGKVEMRKNQILTDGEVAEGLILTCQSHPTTAKLVVDYDDV